MDEETPRGGGAEPQAAADALVVACHGAQATLLLPDGTQVQGRAARRNLAFVCGDRVRCSHDVRHSGWLVQALHPRRSVLHRSNARGRPEAVAANLSLLVVVVAPLPAPDFYIVDRYLCAARSAGIASLVVANKSDLPAAAGMAAELAVLEAAGTRVLHCSTNAGVGLDALLSAVRGETVMLVGQSGVGKSSLLRALVPEAGAEVGELIRGDEGRHTTSVTRWHALAQGGALIDAPGVRDFAPAAQVLDPGSLGFAEIEAAATGCRFADCAHLEEPACAVRQGVDSGAIAARRYESYRRLRRLRSQLIGSLPWDQRQGI
jgi:ribosome biogenesis GTPase